MKAGNGLVKNSFKIGVFVTILTCICMVSCNTKNNTAVNRQWEAFNTRYNVYFNGDEHFKVTLDEMEKNYEDDYSRQLMMHPADARADKNYPQPSGDFTRSIEKMQKAIQLHSITKKPAKRSSSQKDREFRSREEFNPFLHNAWLMLGKAQYYNGDFPGAASTFHYISRHFTWLPEVVTEARLWEARSYCALGWHHEAENILHLIKEKDLTSQDLQDLYNFVEADYLILTGQIPEACIYLHRAAESSSGTQKNRLWFLLGQLYENIGEKQKAFEAFRNAEGGVSVSYRTKFNARIKQSEVFSGKDITKEVKSLKSLAKYERNSEYLDRIYYAIGNLYLSRKDTTEATKNYIIAIEKSQNQGIDMALAQLALGNIYFAERKYVEAQPCYAIALTFIPDTYSNYKILKQRSEVLDELAQYSGNIILQDSLIALSKLSYEERVKVAEKLIAKLEREEKLAKDEAEREEFLASQPQTGFNDNSLAVPGFQSNNDDSWYFYNSYAKNAGRAEFQRKWGSRKLEDDWRRKNKNSFSFDEFEYQEDGIAEEMESLESVDKLEGGKLEGKKEEEEERKKAADPHYVEYYLRQIPKTDEEIEVANDIIQESLYNMGLILKDKLEDYPAARNEFLTLENRYPDNQYSLEVYYNLYLMAARENDREEAEIWRQKILSAFPESNYGIAMKNPDYFDNLRHMHEVQENLYEEAYSAYLNNQNDSVHTLTREMENKYPLSPILPKFVFINSLSYFTEGDYQKFQAGLTELLQRWPDTDMTDMASSILRGIKSGYQLQATNENTRGMIWNTRLTDKEEEELKEDGLPVNFENDPDSPQYLVLAYPLDSVNPNLVLYEVARFNFSTFLVKDFDLEQMSFSNIGLLIIKGFDNQRQLEYYRTMLEKADLNLSPEVIPILISKSNFELLLREGRTFEDYFRFREESVIEETESKILEESETN